ncbi:MAG: 30S ribosomal protein S8 [Chloroflexi bacterium]|nr:30S ribosomal protein S8 [Chloroflexota bacterium]
MPVTDPIADMLTRIRNAVQVRHESVMVPASKMKLNLVGIFRDEGFVTGYQAVEAEPHPMLKIDLRYYEDGEPVIQGLKRVSRPGLRVFVGRDEIPRYFGGLGVAFVSTSSGVMTGREAKRRGIGGELLFYVW